MQDDSEFRQRIQDMLDVPALLDHLGIELENTTSGHYRGKCPLHEDSDNSTAFSVIFGDRNPWWTCRTACNAHGDIFDLVGRMKGLSFNDSIYYLAQYVGLSKRRFHNENSDEDLIHNKDSNEFKKHFAMQRLQKQRDALSEPSPFINEEFVQSCHKNGYGYFLKRGYPQDILDTFKVGFCYKGTVHQWGEHRITIPIYKEDGTLVGISGRRIDNIEDMKYKILSGSKKGVALYGLNLIKEKLGHRKILFLTEGFSDVWRFWQYGIKNVVGLMGKDITRVQFDVLKRTALSVVIALDGDEPGVNGSKALFDKLKDFFTVYSFPTPKNKDVGDLQKQEFDDCYHRIRKFV